MNWDELYQKNPKAFGEEANSFLSDSLSSLMAKEMDKPGEAIVLACGQGRNAFYLEEQGFRVTAMDRSKVGIEQARLESAEKEVKISWVETDLLKEPNLPLNDFTLWCWLHMPVGARKEMYQKVKTALRPGGLLLLEGFREENQNYKIFGPPTSKLLFSLTELLEEFADYEIIEAREMDRPIAEGNQHQGMAAVVQFIVKKPGV